MHAQPLVLGIDLGTSGCKCGLFSGDGSLIACERSRYPTVRGADGRAEQDPEDWWRSTSEACRRVVGVAAVSPARIHAVGIGGQIPTHVLVDRQGRPLRPAVTWQDVRSGQAWPALDSRFGRMELADALGIDLPQGPAWPLPRLLWLQKEEPATLARAWRFLLAKDYVAYRLTGELAIDASSWRGLVHTGTELPATEILQALELPLDLLARVRKPWDVMGSVTPGAATTMGLLPGTPVVTGWNDFNCALLGSGLAAKGSGFSISGTSDHLGMTWDEQLPSHGIDRLMFAPYMPAGTEGPPRVVYGVTTAGGGSLDWYARQFVPDSLAAYGFGVPADIRGVQERLAGSVPAGSSGLIFLPYIHGERAPIWDSSARGVLFGLHGAHRHAHVMRAMLEGVAFSLRHVLETVEAATGLPIDSLRASGGPIGSPLWNRIKASVLRRPLLVPRVLDAGCLGAAILAGVGAGWYASPLDAAAAMVHTDHQVDPEERDVALYDELFAIYVSLYPRLKDQFAELAKLRSMEGYTQ